MPGLVPLDGQFVRSEAERARVCAASGHPKLYLNLSVSGKVGHEVRQCHCGAENEAAAALREYRRKKKEKQAS